MKATFLREPELEFGNGGRHIDIRFGLAKWGPLDVASSAAPRQIRVGIVGVPRDVEALRAWLERCRGEINAKESRQPNLFPHFPGFSEDTAFRSTLVMEDALTRELSDRRLSELAATATPDELIGRSAKMFCEEFQSLREHRAIDVYLCAVPPQLTALIEPGSRAPHGRVHSNTDFHDLLKALAMDDDMHVQLVLPWTYGARPARARTGGQRSIQDEATRAWNLHAALYYKAKGLPWRLARDSSRLTTCFVGVSFYKSRDDLTLMTSMAQVFDERGDGIVVRGAPVKLTKSDRVPHLSLSDAQSLLSAGLGSYREVHKHLPARVVVHKTSTFTQDEAAGMRSAANASGIDSIDMLSLSEESGTRMFRKGSYPPLRGTLLSLDAEQHLLFTRGSVDFYETYPGSYVPSPLAFRCDHCEETPRNLGMELLGLSKMNWNKSQFDGGAPITTLAARRVGKILKYVPEGGRVAPRYSFYM